VSWSWHQYESVEFDVWMPILPLSNRVTFRRSVSSI
jgi:hypothetical protein